MQSIACRGCGAIVGHDGEVPAPDHCGECPAWICDGCGELDSAEHRCACWLSLDGMALADLKALFAGSDMSIDLPR